MPRTKWSEIRRPLMPEDEADVRAEVQAEVVRMGLADLRRMRSLSQTTIARRLGMSQGDVSRLEHRADMYLSTLRSYIEAAGGTLRLLATFPEAEPIEIDTFAGISPPTGSVKGPARQQGDLSDHAHRLRGRKTRASVL